MRDKIIGVIDYGMGNIASVENSFTSIGVTCRRITSPKNLLDCDRLVLPGVGSFNAAMRRINNDNWAESILNFSESGKPLLGICLGMQILFEKGIESGEIDGLGLIKGKVLQLNASPNIKVPHVGWNSLINLVDHPLMKGIRSSVDVYFVHSYHCVPYDQSTIIAHCDFDQPFVASVAKDNIAGMQFHPEKSQPNGLKILKNFSEWNPQC